MPTIVHFDLPADDVERARTFYEKLFEWKFEKVPMEMPYYLFQTTDLAGNNAVGGGLGQRGAPDQRITNYIGVPDVEKYMAKVEKLGGTIIMQKTAVPGWGYLAVCVDTENNTFGLWEEDRNAK